MGKLKIVLSEIKMTLITERERVTFASPERDTEIEQLNIRRKWLYRQLVKSEDIRKFSHPKIKSASANNRWPMFFIISEIYIYK